MLDQKLFGEKLRNHRKKLSLTQEEVAERVRVSPTEIIPTTVLFYLEIG